MPEQFQQGIAPVSRLMEELIPVYKKKIGYGKGLLGLCICHISYDEIPG